MMGHESVMGDEERLRRYTEDHQAYLKQERERHKAKPNENMVKDAPDFLASYDFWCDTCQEDFTAPCYKTHHRLFGDSIACYRSRCPECGKEALRHITHRDEDMYYAKSAKIRRQRNQFAAEILQAQEYGFKTYYGDPDKDFNEKMMKKEEAFLKEKSESGLKGFSIEELEKKRRFI